MKWSLALTAGSGFSLLQGVTAFVSPQICSKVAQSRHEAITSSASTARSEDVGARIGDAIASAIVSSPVYPLLISQAKNTMKVSAKNIGVEWDKEVEALRAARDWDAEMKKLMEGSRVETPGYYMKPFHAYRRGNLCWEAAWEQELASKSVGVRNFPDDAERGEHRLRKAYETQMERLGALVEEGALLVDMGCGTGTSTRYLAEQFPNAGRVLGIELSPHMLLVGRHFLEGRERREVRKCTAKELRGRQWSSSMEIWPRLGLPRAVRLWC
ncbi:unnamed protein product, partial [Discosporangium mesarthrocarpum]